MNTIFMTVLRPKRGFCLVKNSVDEKILFTSLKGAECELDRIACQCQEFFQEIKTVEQALFVTLFELFQTLSEGHKNGITLVFA